ncbi:VWA domain-containing protein [Salinisphaera sp. Q1T1-3]|uniref:vWA domain-containing protein n=1 Tax=Salinisphaera sp. Q1T1-3 TaxID=2321229 RepID=UPI000E75A08A|nr:VWA domain-containing protein [Salinisphaera sp. Q1T1-3]RJS94365.1 VWA domain-containing protein [Salinisphaera sp. Q1T1-3]
MLIAFFQELRRGGLAVSVGEFLTLLEALDAHLAGTSVTAFHALARMTLVKDETRFDLFDRIFGHYFRGIESLAEPEGEVPAAWLEKMAELELDDAQKRRVEALGGWEALMQTLRERLAEQGERHQGGNKWIGTAGRSPFGAYGYNPEGVRIGQHTSREQRAVKVWDNREYADLADDRQLGVRNLQVALRRLRRFAREGAADELDLGATIRATARQGGQLDLVMRPERRNAMKLLLLFDVGGSMDAHVSICEQLFSAARSEFAHLSYFYFHNFIYESVWQDNARRHSEQWDTSTLCRTFGSDYRVIIVGDASMSPYEIAYPGGSVEHFNAASGESWLRHLLTAFPRTVWLNPVPAARWAATPSIGMTRELMGDRMFALTPAGLDLAINELSSPAQAVR